MELAYRFGLGAATLLAVLLSAGGCQPAPAPHVETREECMARLDGIDPTWREHMPFECDDHPAYGQ